MSAFRIRDIQESFGSQFLAVEASAPSDGKATTFLNIVDPAGSPISHIIDINPRKAGRFVPGSGQEIVPPSTLSELHPKLSFR
jgi:hypothetical protein